MNTTTYSMNQVVWAVRDGTIGHAFFDEDAAAFLLPSLASRLRPSGGPARFPFVRLGQQLTFTSRLGQQLTFTE